MSGRALASINAPIKGSREPGNGRGVHNSRAVHSVVAIRTPVSLAM
jgi:hypothetical protein